MSHLVLKNRVPDPETIYRFYEFEFGTRRRELRKSGHRVRISASQIRLLTLFLERHGELVTREDIAGRVWTETATIDVANGVNTAINRLRYHLGDSSASPRFLETVIGLGYRFIAPVEMVAITEETAANAAEVSEPADRISDPESLLPEVIHQPVTLPSTSRTSRLWMLWSVLAILMVAGIVTLFLHNRRKAVAPVTEAASAGVDFSRVTSNRAGRQITAAAISPDGKFLAYADSSGVRVQALATQKEFSLAALPVSQVTHISWFSSQNDLAVSGLDLGTHRPQVWVSPLSGIATLMADNAALATVSPDGAAVAFTKADGGELWIAGQNGVNLRRLVTAEGNSVFSFLLWSPDSRRLMLVSHSRDVNPAQIVAPDSAKPLIPDIPGEGNSQQKGHWRYDSIDAVSGRQLAREENVRMESAVLLPNGHLRYVTGAQDRNSLARGRIFSVETDPASGRFLGTPAKDDVFSANSLSSISSSQDGATMAILAHTETADVFTASLHRTGSGSLPALDDVQRVTSELTDAYPHAWAADGTIIYEADARGHESIYGKLSQGASPQLLAKLPMTAAMAQLTPDGHWIIFLGIEAEAASLYRVPAAGGAPPERLPGGEGVDEVRCALTGAVPCVVRKVENRDGVRERLYFALDPIAGIGKLLARTPWEPSRRGDWGLSPDGSTVVVANHDTLHPALSFLKLDGASGYEKTQPLLGHGAPLGAGWTTDGKDLFVETRTGSGLELLYLSHDGRVQVLRESPSVIWAVPSPNGRQIAFPAYTTNSNVWVSDAQPVKR